MALPIRPNNPNIPIPNSTFSSPLNAYVNGPYFPVVMGTGIDITTPGKVADLNNAGLLEFNGAVGDVNLLAGPGIAVTEVDNDFTIDNTGVISLIAGTNIQISGSNGTYTISSTDAQTGTVTSVGTGVGLTGGPITTSGTISLDVSGVTPGSYTYSDLTVDAYGRITMVSNGVAPVTTVTGTAPVQVTGTAPSLTVAVASSSTTAPGVVQLVDALNSTSTTQALTAAQGKVLQDQISALAAASNLTFAGTIDGATGLMVSVSTEAAGLTTPFVVGQAMPAAAAENEDYFTIVSAAGTMTPPGGSSTVTTVGDWFLSTGTAYQFLDTGFNPPYASTTEAGIVELADNAETQAGTDATLAVTAAGLQSKVSDSVSTASSTSIASSQAVKDAYDAATAAQTDATQALSDAAAAQATADAALPLSGGTMTGVINFAPGQTVPVGSIQDGTLTQKGVVQLEDSVSSTSTTTAATPNSVKQAYDAAAAAQVDATQALSDASSAQTDATQALSDAASAQTDATQALADAAAAQTDATQALADAAAAGADVGDLSTLTTTDKSSAVAAINEVNAAASNAQTDATQALADASAAQADATQALADSAAAQTDATQALADAATAQADATQALADAASAQATADAALPLVGGTMTGDITFNANQTFPGTVGNLDFQAKGDLVAGFGANSFGIASVGTNGQILYACSTAASGLCWAAAPSVANATPNVAGVVKAQTNSGSLLNTALGDNATSTSVTGERNTAIGAYAALSLSSGSWNTVAGQGAAASLTTGCDNTWYGYSSGPSSTGNRNTGVGASVLPQLTSGNNNVAIGQQSGFNLTTGCFNVAIGDCVQVATAAGSCQLAIGFSDTDNWITGTSTKAIKPGAGIVDCAGSCGTTGQVLSSNGSNAIEWITAGSGASPATPTVAGILEGYSCGVDANISVGYGSLAAIDPASGGCINTSLGVNALSSLTFGARNIAIGHEALCTATNTYSNVAIGACALQNTTLSNNVAIGDLAGYAITTGNANVAIGTRAMVNATTPSISVAIGCRAMQCASGSGNIGIGMTALCKVSGSYNVGLGISTGQNITTGAGNTFLGALTGGFTNTGSCNVFIGFGTGPLANTDCCLWMGLDTAVTWLTGDGTSAIKPGAGIIDCAGSCGTAGQVLSSNGSNAIEWIAAGGGGGGSPATPSTEGTVYAYTDLYDQATPAGGNAALGNGAGAALTSTDLHNTIVGSFAGGSLTGVTGQTALGFGALAQATTPTTPSEVNVALGYLSGMSVTTGGNNILIGQQAGLNYTTESGNIIIGNTAGGAAADAGIIRIGHGSQQAYIELDAGGAIDISGSTAGTAGQVLTSAGPNNPPTWATPSGGSPFLDYSGGVASTTNGTKINIVGWPNEDYRNYIGQFLIWVVYANAPGNPMYFMGSNAIIMLNSYNGRGSSTVQAMSTATGTFAVEEVLYPAYSDVTVTYTPTVSTSDTNFYVQYLPMVNGGPQISYLGALYPLPGQ